VPIQHMVLHGPNRRNARKFLRCNNLTERSRLVLSLLLGKTCIDV
jgi:hypothetical protein